MISNTSAIMTNVLKEVSAWNNHFKVKSPLKHSRTFYFGVESSKVEFSFIKRFQELFLEYILP